MVRFKVRPWKFRNISGGVATNDRATRSNGKVKRDGCIVLHATRRKVIQGRFANLMKKDFESLRLLESSVMRGSLNAVFVLLLAFRRW